MDTTPRPDQAVLFEPQAGMPVSDQGVLHDLFAATRRPMPIVWALLALFIGVAGLVVPGQPAGFTGPGLATAVGLLTLVQTFPPHLFLSSGEFAALAASPTRQVVLGEGELRQAGRVVGIRLPDEDRWVVGRLPATDAMMLARLRRVWVFGPSPGERVGVLVPGGSGPRVARLAAAPPSGAALVATPPAAQPASPAEDPAVRLALRQRLLISLVAVALNVLMIGLVTVDARINRPAEPLFDNVRWVVPVALFVLLLVLNLVGIGRIARAGRSERWTWTRVVVSDLRIVNATRARLRLRVDVPRDEINLELYGAPALALAVYVSEQLWIPGELRSTGSMIVGIPGAPAVGQMRVVKRPR